MAYRFDKPGVKNTSPESARPIHSPDQISLGDVVPNTAITVLSQRDRTDRQRYVIASYPYLDNNLHCLAVQVETNLPKSSSQWADSAIKKLSDLGISQRPDGTWDQDHYSLVDYKWTVRTVELSNSLGFAYKGYKFVVPDTLPLCTRDCCQEYPIEHVEISRPGYSPPVIVKLTKNWQRALYIDVKQNDNRSILIRRIT